MIFARRAKRLRALREGFEGVEHIATSPESSKGEVRCETRTAPVRGEIPSASVLFSALEYKEFLSAGRKDSNFLAIYGVVTVTVAN